MTAIYLIGATEIAPTDEGFQETLAAAYRDKVRPRCGCNGKGPEMYIAHRGDRYIVKRMPNSAADHAPDCGSFDLPEELSGLGHISGAIDTDPDAAETVLKLDFALSLKGKRPPPPMAGGEPPQEAAAPVKKMGLTALLHFLWHEAELTKWHPAMDGKRHWGIIHRELLAAAAAKSAKKVPLTSVIYCPPAFNAEQKNTQSAARKAFLAGLIRKADMTSTPVGILIAEYKGHERTPHGAKFTFRHIPDQPFFAAKELADRFEKLFGERIRTVDMLHGTRLMAIATFSISPGGYPTLIEIGTMMVTAQWLPFDTAREFELLEALVMSKRRFVRSLRFGLPKSAAIAAAVLTDTQPMPYALFIQEPDAAEATLAELGENALNGVYPSWIWLRDEAMHGFP